METGKAPCPYCSKKLKMFDTDDNETKFRCVYCSKWVRFEDGVLKKKRKKAKGDWVK